MLVKLPHWTVVVPPPELVAFAVEVVVVPPEVDDDPADADADENAEEPLAVAVAEELVEPDDTIAPSRGMALFF
jgi:hypothetical protein